MTQSKEHIILFIQIDEQIPYITEIHFTKNELNYDMTYCSNNSLLMNENNFILENEIDSRYLEFTCNIDNKCNPSNYLDWLFNDKSIFEYNYGRIFKLSIKKNNIDKKCNEFEINFFHCFNNISYKKIIDYVNCYENIYQGIFSNDYSKEYGNKNVKFVKVSEV